MEADSAEIVIGDGKENTQKILDRETVRQGAFRYVRNSEDVRIQITFFSGGKPFCNLRVGTNSHADRTG